eukprot:Tamp_33357.p1 GENE.Tamp_33357~~Tamp_33357.p1  ORF type:complete len:139 (-),score=7.40 Tamp_33357:67-483(-)
MQTCVSLIPRHIHVEPVLDTPFHDVHPIVQGRMVARRVAAAVPTHLPQSHADEDRTTPPSLLQGRRENARVRRRQQQREAGGADPGASLQRAAGRGGATHRPITLKRWSPFLHQKLEDGQVAHEGSLVEHRLAAALGL